MFDLREPVRVLHAVLEQAGIDTAYLSVNVCEQCHVAVTKAIFEGVKYPPRYVPQIAGLWVTSAIPPMPCLLCAPREILKRDVCLSQCS